MVVWGFKNLKMLKKLPTYGMVLRALLWLGILLAAGWLGAAPAHAASDGGLSYNIGPSFSVGAGVGYSMRDVHLSSNWADTDVLSSSRFLVKPDIAPVRYVDIYGLIGAAELELQNRKFDGTLGLDWGVGLRPQLFPLVWNNPLNITLDGQFVQTRSADHNTHATLDEVQASLIFSYVMKSLAPYGGLKYDHTWMEFKSKRNEMQDKLDWGLFIGCDYFVTQNVFFNLELTIFAETAAFLSTGYKY
jgi:hypothetical protein